MSAPGQSEADNDVRLANQSPAQGLSLHPSLSLAQILVPGTGTLLQHEIFLPPQQNKYLLSTLLSPIPSLCY